MSVMALSPAVTRVRAWPSTTMPAPVARSRNTVPTWEIMEPISRYHTGTKATSRTQASRLRTCAARVRRMAVSSCWRIARHLLDPPARQVADPVETLMLKDQVADDHGRGSGRSQLAGQVPEGKVGLPVKALVGLVQEQHRRVVHQGQGQAECLRC